MANTTITRRNLIVDKKKVNVLGYSVWLFFMVIIGFIMTYPFVFSFLGSLMRADDFGQNLGVIIPEPIIPLYLRNLTLALRRTGLPPLLNTIARTTWYTVIICLKALLMGYVMARYEFKLKNTLFILIISSQVIPGILTLLPTFVMASNIPLVGGNDIMGQGGRGLINSRAMLYLPLSWNYLIWVFLMMQSLKGLPPDFEEAAEIDGASFMHIIFKIVLPMQLPILAVIAVNVALFTWNDWLTPFLYISDPMRSTLPAWVGQLTARLQEFGDRNYPRVFGLGTMATLPPFFIFLFLQKYILQGIASAGIKG